MVTPPYRPYYAAFPSRPPVVRVVWVVCGFQVPLPVVWWWVLGLGFAPPRPLWCGWWGLGFRVEGQQLGAQTETVTNLGACCRIAHITKP